MSIKYMTHINVGEVLIFKLNTEKKLQEALNTFSMLDHNYQRMNYAEHLIEKYCIIKDEIRRSKKSNIKSAELREKGNKSIKESRNYYEAIDYYNQSICFAKPDSECMALGYSNRSAIYMAWHEWKLCLVNIQMSRDCPNFPEKLLSAKLKSREELCLKALEKENSKAESEARLPFQVRLSFAPNDRVPYIANCLQLNKNQKFGRYITSNRDLNVGDWVAIETPFSVSLQSDFIYTRCAFCLSENSYMLIPCTECTRVMFCNEECRKKGYDLFHRFECSAIDAIIGEATYIHTRNAIRSVAKVFSSKPELEKIERFVKNVNMDHTNIFTVDQTDMSISGRYKACHTLMTNEHYMEFPEKVTLCINAAVITYLLKDNEHVKKIFKNAEHKHLFYELLWQHIQISILNHFTLTYGGEWCNMPIDRGYAIGTYPFLSLLNHSCMSNVTGYSYQNSKIALCVTRQIKKGDQIYVNYAHYLQSDFRNHHIVGLTGVHSFKFICNHCTCTLPNSKSFTADFALFEVVRQLAEYDKTNAEKAISTMTDYLKHFKPQNCDSNEWTREILNHAFNIFLDNIPLHFKNKK